MTASKEIMNRLNEVFAPMDAEVHAATLVWAEERVAAVAEFKKSDRAKELLKSSSAYYRVLFEIAGGKTWYSALYGRSAESRADVVANHCARVAESRNASIASKLEKAGVTEIISEEFHRTNDGFNGCFVVETDKGRKAVTINTIRAGGYNIQCLHLRVLVKIK